MPGNSKYRVIDTRTGQEVRGAFVLLPDTDKAARPALAAYAEATDSGRVAKLIRTWLDKIRNASRPTNSPRRGA